MKKITLPRTAAQLEARLLALRACSLSRERTRGLTLRKAWKAANLNELLWWLANAIGVTAVRLDTLESRASVKAEKTEDARIRGFAEDIDVANALRTMISFDGKRPVRLVAGKRR